MKSKQVVRLAFGLGLSLTVLVGCAVSADDASSAAANFTEGSDAGSDAAADADADATVSAKGSALTAKIATKQVLRDTPACKVTISVPVVDTGRAAANAEIARVLTAPEADPFCETFEPDETRSAEGGFAVATNERGILALTTSVTSSGSAFAHDNVDLTAFTFELQTGKRLKISDVLNATGIAAARASCTAELAKGMADASNDTVENMTAMAEASCDSALGSNPRGFTVENEGLRLQMEMSHAMMAIGESLIPWSKLQGGGLNAGIVADFVKAAK